MYSVRLACVRSASCRMDASRSSTARFSSEVRRASSAAFSASMRSLKAICSAWALRRASGDTMREGREGGEGGEASACARCMAHARPPAPERASPAAAASLCIASLSARTVRATTSLASAARARSSSARRRCCSATCDSSDPLSASLRSASLRRASASSAASTAALVLAISDQMSGGACSAWCLRDGSESSGDLSPPAPPGAAASSWCLGSTSALRPCGRVGDPALATRAAPLAPGPAPTATAWDAGGLAAPSAAAKKAAALGELRALPPARPSRRDVSAEADAAPVRRFEGLPNAPGRRVRLGDPCAVTGDEPPSIRADVSASLKVEPCTLRTASTVGASGAASRASRASDSAL